jgi:hypothetical protein
MNPDAAIVLCEDGDAGAFWAVSQFQKRGLAVELVTASAMEVARRWHHSIVGQTVATRIDLADGRVIDSARAQPILNRLGYIPTARLYATAGSDFGYAKQEIFALYLSWLGGWPARVINRAVPQGLCGNYRSPSEWVTIAHRAGLPAAPWRQAQDDPPERGWAAPPGQLAAYVCAGAVVAGTPLPEALHPACVRLADLAGCELLGLSFEAMQVQADGAMDWRFTFATPMPQLAIGGEALGAALVAALAVPAAEPAQRKAMR